jgi:peptidylprolyl isomerase
LIYVLIHLKVFKKADGSQYDVDGKLYDQVDIRMVIDGYNAPLTGGNFVDLVDKGYYTKRPINRADGFVVQTGDADPGGTGMHGYVPPGSKEERKVPLEISLKGDENLLYGTSAEDEGRGSAQSTLQFQSYGALGMAREEFVADSASTQFFWLLFESDLTPAGRNLLDGRYALFGYTLDGADLLKDVKEGDIIASAKVIKGIENLSRGSGTTAEVVAVSSL